MSNTTLDALIRTEDGKCARCLWMWIFWRSNKRDGWDRINQRFFNAT